MKRILVAALAAVGAFVALPASDAQARFLAAPIAAPALVEEAQVVIRQRVVRPGRRGFRDRSFRRGGFGNRCRTVRSRIVRPNGSVVFRTTRRCR